MQLLSQQNTGEIEMKNSLGLIIQPALADQQVQEQWMTQLKKNRWRKPEKYLQRLVYGLYLQIWIYICLHMNMNTHKQQMNNKMQSVTLFERMSTILFLIL